MKTGAFFDIDGTLYRDSLMIEHFKRLVKYDVIDPSLWHSHVKQTYEEWKKRIGEFDDYMIELAEIYVDALKGMNRDHISFITDQVIKLQGDKVYAFTRDRIKWHQEQGHHIFFISGSPDFLVSKMSEKYNATDYRGTKYMVNCRNQFNGETKPMYDSENKNKAIDNLVKNYDVDLTVSYAYGDTNGDFSMLKLVGNPVAINPSRELLKAIKGDEQLSEKIDIIVERKDVIYKLDASVQTL